MTIHTLHLETKLVADGFYDVSVRDRPGLVARAVPAPDETEAMLRAAASLSVMFVMQDQD